jgi:hypothetical protein
MVNPRAADVGFVMGFVMDRMSLGVGFFPSTLFYLANYHSSSSSVHALGRVATVIGRDSLSQ